MSRSIRVLASAIAFLILVLALVPGARSARSPPPRPSRRRHRHPTPPHPPQIPAGLRAGLRASNYGITPFPAPSWWVDSIGSMASRFPTSTREQLAVVVEVRAAAAAATAGRTSRSRRPARGRT